MEPDRLARNGLPLTLASAAAVAAGVSAVGISLARRDTVALPGALISLVFYGTCGYFAVRGHPWARWSIFTLASLTALTCAFGTFFSLANNKPEFAFNPALGACSVFFAMIALGMALPPPRPAIRPLSNI